jgi:hypothetical protein
MDPVTLILTALAAGAAASAKDTASEAIKDAYSGLKGLILRKFAGKSAAEVALVQHEKKPHIWKSPLEEEIKETRLDQDEEIILAAQRLMTLVQPQQAAMGKYNVQVTGNVQGINQGDYNTIWSFTTFVE